MSAPVPARDHVAAVVGWCLVGVTVMLLPGAPASAHPATDPASYAWVSPPPGVTTTGPPAQGREATLDADLLAQGRADVWTPDLQALVTVEGSAPVTVLLEPRDPAALPPLPGLEASGNAYEVRVDGDVEEAAIFLRPPHQVDTMAQWDGADWTLTTVSPGPNGEVWAPAPTGSATFVAAAPRLDGHSSAVAAFVHDPLRVAVATAGLVAGAIGLHRRRRLAQRSFQRMSNIVPRVRGHGEGPASGRLPANRGARHDPVHDVRLVPGRRRGAGGRGADPHHP